MPVNRYENKDVISNAKRAYLEQRKARKTNVIKHYNSPNLSYPNTSQMRRITPLEHTWKLGDRYYKLAHKHYGDSSLWWLVAWFNKAPTESHLEMGQTIYVPLPLEAALSFLVNY